MSDHEVRAALDRMEGWIGQPAWEPDPAALEAWNTEYQAALATAERGPSWPALVERAHGLGRKLEVRLDQATQMRDAIRAELGIQERGNRALAGYGASTR